MELGYTASVLAVLLEYRQSTGGALGNKANI